MPVRVQIIYSLDSIGAFVPSNVKMYVPVGRATPLSSVALSSVALVAQTATFKLRVVLKSEMTLTVFTIFIVY